MGDNLQKENKSIHAFLFLAFLRSWYDD